MNHPAAGVSHTEHELARYGWVAEWFKAAVLKFLERFFGPLEKREICRVFPPQIAFGDFAKNASFMAFLRQLGGQ